MVYVLIIRIHLGGNLGFKWQTRTWEWNVPFYYVFQEISRKSETKKRVEILGKGTFFLDLFGKAQPMFAQPNEAARMGNSPYEKFPIGNIVVERHLIN